MAREAEKIRSINTPGWDGVNSNADVTRIHNVSEQESLDLLYNRCFGTDAGQKVLEHLISLTLDQPCWTPGADPSFGYAREGQNSIIREIQQRIKRNKNGRKSE